MLKIWKYQLIFDCFLPEILNIGHLLCQLCYLIILLNLHDRFMKYLLFLSYDNWPSKLDLTQGQKEVKWWQQD